MNLYPHICLLLSIVHFVIIHLVCMSIIHQLFMDSLFKIWMCFLMGAFKQSLVYVRGSCKSSSSPLLKHRGQRGAVFAHIVFYRPPTVSFLTLYLPSLTIVPILTDPALPRDSEVLNLVYILILFHALCYFLTYSYTIQLIQR